ncbi:DinB family protein [Echinicola sp. 20G]|uniref:DinB family protein n=1 Tax=Echinicola sp. 20G TaxID=2781961 RepID=UPI0019108385|nr:DinB family protein [Echinicola sp. 20G]
MNEHPIVTEIKKHATFRLKENSAKINSCLEWLSEEEIWHRPNDASNSMGNLVLHLCGNVTQYIISSLGQQEDLRDRDQEFSASGGYSKEELIEKLTNTINDACSTIDKLDQEGMETKYSVQGFSYTGVGNIIHAVEHFSYHTGQIAFWTKILRQRDLGFYAGMDLNQKNRTK